MTVPPFPVPPPPQPLITTQHILTPGPPYSYRAVLTAGHPQLRDLLVYSDIEQTVSVACYSSIATHALDNLSGPTYARLRFNPSSIVSGMGLLAAGGQNAEIALKADNARSSWCHQITDPAASINNSIHITPAPLSTTVPRLLVSNNDESIKVYEVAGPVPDYQAAKRRRDKQRRTTNGALGLVSDEGSATLSNRDDDSVQQGRRRKMERYEEGEDVAMEGEDGQPDQQHEVEEDSTFDRGGACTLARLEHLDVQLHTAINHCSTSPDGRRLVAVGDTNEIFLFDCASNGQFNHVQTFEASEDASFSTSWRNEDQFAVASQDGTVGVFDVRNLPRAGRGSRDRPPRRIATLKTTQGGPAGAARKVKFSTGSSVDADLLAFTEHRSRVHIVDARTFESMQLLEVPVPTSSSPSPAPRARPRVYPRQPSRPFIDNLYSSDEPPRPSDSATSLISAEDERFMRRLLSRGGAGRPLSPPWRSRRTELGSAPEERVQWDGDETEEEDEEEGEEEEEDGEDEDEEIERRLDSVMDEASAAMNESLPEFRTRQPPIMTGSSNSALTSLMADLPPFHLPNSSSASSSSSSNSSPFASPNARRRQIIQQTLSGYSPLTLQEPQQSYTSYASYVSPGGGTSYAPNSLYFPVEATPSDLLGLDWSEEGSLFVATEGRVWEWEVDTRARRSFATFEFR